MPHPDIKQPPGLVINPLYLTDESGASLLVTVLQSTWAIKQESLALAEEQLPVKLAGEFYTPGGSSSYKYEPQYAFTKLATDVVLIGHAQPRVGWANELDVSLSVGSLKKIIRVRGDRYWIKTFGIVSMTSPEPFECIPLTYERAFGGWDRSHTDPSKHVCEPRNPVGTGFRSKQGNFEEGIRLPNLEDPRESLLNYGQTVNPVGFGFTSPDWQPRGKLAGTYDAQWMSERMPLLPHDFDRRFFNAASPGLVAPGYLQGNESVSIQNASRRGSISFNLPGIPPPECCVHLRGRRGIQLQTNLDTIIINTDEDLVLLLWRGYLPVRNGPHDVVAIEIQSKKVAQPAGIF